MLVTCSIPYLGAYAPVLELYHRSRVDILKTINDTVFAEATYAVVVRVKIAMNDVTYPYVQLALISLLYASVMELMFFKGEYIAISIGKLIWSFVCLEIGQPMIMCMRGGVGMWGCVPVSVCVWWVWGCGDACVRV